MDGSGVTTTEGLRQLYGEPSALARDKTLDRLDKHCRAFIAASPFLVLGTASAEGPADVSPKGDAPGFVQVLDERALLIPDRRGNNRVDGLQNVLENPHVALIFLVPGMNETLRVNGRAEIVTDPARLEPLSAQGKPPTSALLVHVEEAFLHCGKALIRSRLWDPDTQIDRKAFPTLGKMIADQIEGVDVEEAESRVEESYRERLY